MISLKWNFFSSWHGRNIAHLGWNNNHSLLNLNKNSTLLKKKPNTFSHKIDVRFVFISSCLYEVSCLIYIICVCLCIVETNTYCVVFFVLFVCLLCLVYPMLFFWIVYFWLSLRFSLTLRYARSQRKLTRSNCVMMIKDGLPTYLREMLFQV